MVDEWRESIRIHVGRSPIAHDHRGRGAATEILGLREIGNGQGAAPLPSRERRPPRRTRRPREPAPRARGDADHFSATIRIMTISRMMMIVRRGDDDGRTAGKLVVDDSRLVGCLVEVRRPAASSTAASPCRLTARPSPRRLSPRGSAGMYERLRDPPDPATTRCWTAWSSADVADHVGVCCAYAAGAASSYRERSTEEPTKHLHELPPPKVAHITRLPGKHLSCPQRSFVPVRRAAAPVPRREPRAQRVLPFDESMLAPGAPAIPRT